MILASLKTLSFYQLVMLRNYLKLALRNFWKSKGYSAINIVGLAIGMATCLLITLFVTDELSYDKYNEKVDRIYRVNTDLVLNGSQFNAPVTGAPMAGALIKDCPQVENAVRIKGGGEILVKKGKETLTEPHAFFADPSLFDLFTLPMITGDPKTALIQPNSLVISETIAQKYFNSTDVLGKTLLVDNTTPYQITGVIKDVPAQSHLHFSFIRSISSDPYSRSDFWLNNDCMTYLLVRSGTTQQTLDSFLKQVARKYTEPQLQNITHSSFADLEKKGDHYRYNAVPLAGIHLHSTLSGEVEPSGNIEYVYVFIIVAAFILLIACVNFMNLSTARSAGRSKEVGVRKVLGSDRSSLMMQFLTESILTSLFSLLIALLLTILFLPYFNQISGKEINLGLLSKIWLLPSLLAITVIIGILAGIYPAFFLSAFNPVQVLKGNLAIGFKGGWLRNSLVVFQFAAAIILIICTLVIYNQLHFIRSKNLGYDREQILVLKNAYSLGIHASTFKNEVLQIPGVAAAARTGSLPTESSNEWNQNAYSKDAAMSTNQSILIADWRVDADFVSTLGMKMAAGRNFSSQMPTDSSAMIINEAAARLLGYKNPLQQRLYDASPNKTGLQIIGILKDFNAGSMRYKPVPVLMRLSEQGDRFVFRIKSNNIPALIGQIERKYHSVDQMAGQPFSYTFMDDDFNRLYQSEQRTGKVFISFAFFAILIACLGLFGLVTYAAQQRTKEIGIRKVLGATVVNVTALLSKDFILLVLLAILIASPIAWLAMYKWLQGFAYRTAISWWVFAFAAIISLLIAMITVSFQAVKAALSNPVESLRSE